MDCTEIIWLEKIKNKLEMGMRNIQDKRQGDDRKIWSIATDDVKTKIGRIQQ